MTSQRNPSTPGGLTANDRFKRRSSQTFWTGLMAAAMLHFLAFAFFPEFTVAVPVDHAEPLTVLEPLPEFVIPPPPEQIPRPAMPVASDLDDLAPPAATTFVANPPLAPTLPAPSTRSDDTRDAHAFVPTTLGPRLLNREDAQRALQRAYPSMLRDAGIGGTPTVWIHIDESGSVIGADIHESSGQESLDAAALAVARTMKFSAAMNRDRKVAVWVSIPIVFTAKRPVPDPSTR